jgi:hypothetical protein
MNAVNFCLALLLALLIVVSAAGPGRVGPTKL